MFIIRSSPDIFFIKNNFYLDLDLANIELLALYIDFSLFTFKRGYEFLT